ncbi:MAG: SBBP repeat-containing protein [Candidatus Heimdallarchaeota archaeon]
MVRLYLVVCFLCVSLIAIDCFFPNSSEAGALKDDFKYCLILSGSSFEEGGEISVDGSGNVIATGSTWSEDFPTRNAYDSTHNSLAYTGSPGYADFFVAKFSSSKQLSWSTYLGGTAQDFCKGVTVDRLGDIVVVGQTKSPDFPALNGYATVHLGKEDGVVAKFSSNGSLLWSTFLGGNSTDRVTAAAVDSQDNILVTGFTASKDFPLLNGTDGTQGFVVKISANGSLLWGRSLNGNCGSSKGDAIAIDEDDSILITGSCSGDVSVVKLSVDGSILWRKVLGGEDNDWGQGIGFTSLSNVIIAGSTESVDFPTIAAIDFTHNGGVDAFAAKLSPNGELIWSTFLGGSKDDNGRAVVVEGDDDILIGGQTKSPDFPAVNETGTQDTDSPDVFVAKVSASGSLLWNTLLGGNGPEWFSGVAIENQSNVLIAGSTQSFQLSGIVTRLGPPSIGMQMFLYSTIPIYVPSKATNGGPTAQFLAGILALAVIVVVRKTNRKPRLVTT